MKQFAFVPAVLFVAALAASCSSVPLEPGATRYSRGELTAVEAAPYREVSEATMDTMRRLKLKPWVADRDGLRTMIVGETVFRNILQSQPYEVRVMISQLTPTTTQMEFRIVGRRDEQRLRTIHAEIRRQLGHSQG